jgi:putative ABC transport system permease protein
VLGANIFSLWGMLSVQFVKLVLISLCIAIPISYYGMNKWLLNYEYRETISWWIFATAGISILLITLLTVSYQSIRAALMNPVNSLRSE